MDVTHDTHTRRNTRFLVSLRQVFAFELGDIDRAGALALATLAAQAEIQRAQRLCIAKACLASRLAVQLDLTGQRQPERIPASARAVAFIERGL